MKKYIYIIPLILLSACLKSPDQKILEIIDIENKIYSTIEDFNPQNIDYKILSNQSDYEVGLAREALYLKLMSTITEPSSEKAIKQRIVSFFEYLDRSSLEGRDVPIKIIYTYRDKTTEILTKTSNGHEYLDVISGNLINETSLFFNIQQKLLFFEELASAKGFIFDLKNKDFLANELCSAVGANELTYASLLIDISIPLFDPGVVRCVSGYPDRHYKGEGSCPMSLRRLSGTNYAHEVSKRINNWTSS